MYFENILKDVDARDNTTIINYISQNMLNNTTIGDVIKFGIIKNRDNHNDTLIKFSKNLDKFNFDDLKDYRKINEKNINIYHRLSDDIESTHICFSTQLYVYEKIYKLKRKKKNG